MYPNITWRWISFWHFRGIYSVQANPEFGFLWRGDLDRIAVRDLGDCAGNSADCGVGLNKGQKGCYQSYEHGKYENGFNVYQSHENIVTNEFHRIPWHMGINIH